MQLELFQHVHTKKDIEIASLLDSDRKHDIVEGSVDRGSLIASMPSDWIRNPRLIGNVFPFPAPITPRKSLVPAAWSSS